MRNLMTNMETTKDTTMPTIRIINSQLVKTIPNLMSFNKLAPNITGIAKKNVNSAATVLETPMSKAPTIVAPEREVPGNIAAINWKIPMINAVLKVISAKLLILALLPLCVVSIMINAIPNTMRAIEIGI